MGRIWPREEVAAVRREMAVRGPENILGDLSFFIVLLKMGAEYSNREVLSELSMFRCPTGWFVFKATLFDSTVRVAGVKIEGIKRLLELCQHAMIRSVEAQSYQTMTAKNDETLILRSISRFRKDRSDESASKAASKASTDMLLCLKVFQNHCV